MFVLEQFGLKDMSDCSHQLRALSAGAASMEEVCNRIVNYLFENLVFLDSNESACALVRMFVSHQYGGLDLTTRNFIDGVIEHVGREPLTVNDLCLFLIASRGIKPEWNSRHTSMIFRGGPLLGRGSLNDDSMGAQLLRQFELDTTILAEPDEDIILDLSRKTFNVFLVQEAEGSEYIPHQSDFVIPHGIKSCVWLMCIMPSGRLAALGFFTRVPVSREVAEILKPLAISVKVALLPFDYFGPIMIGDSAPDKQVIATVQTARAEIVRLGARLHATEELLDIEREVVHDRTALLERAISELNRSNAELQQFAYVASHDLQEPLRAVSGYLDLLSRNYQDKLDERGLALIATARDGATRMSALIRALLDYARIDTRAREVMPTDCNKVVANALSNLRIAVEESSAEIVAGEFPIVQGDSIQLVQLFQNLVGNAIKFRRQDQAPRIDILAERDDDYWQFTVADNGIGFEMTHSDKIFAIFKRLHTRTEYPGTGIGLAVCKKIVERHGGRIWCQSTPGEGTKFSFTLRAIGD